jgi:hypothetical protein
MSTEEQTKEIVDAALAKQVKANGDLAQATAVALRGVLPYARQEVLSIHEVARRDGDEVAASEAAAGDVAIERADKVLRAIDKSHLPISALKDDHFDNHINTYLDESAGEE